VASEIVQQSVRAAIYARVSTSNNGQDPALQTRELREYCERRGWLIAGEYVDSGVSGAKDSRPELNRSSDTNSFIKTSPSRPCVSEGTTYKNQLKIPYKWIALFRLSPPSCGNHRVLNEFDVPLFWSVDCSDVGVSWVQSVPSGHGAVPKPALVVNRARCVERMGF